MGYNLDRLSGHTKEMLGKATGNKKMQVKGKTQHELADLKDKAKDAVQKIEDRLDHMRD